ISAVIKITPELIFKVFFRQKAGVSGPRGLHFSYIRPLHLIDRYLMETKPYQSKNKIRLVTAAALFDGHDAAINIMRRIMQSSGAEVIHLGHDRSVQEVVDCAIQEDANSIAITSY